MALGGCGGSSSNTERTKLVSQLSANLKQGNSAPSDLVSCMTQQGRKLPTPQLRELAHAGSNPPPATERLAVPLLTACLQQGKGLSAFRQLLTQVVTSEIPTTLPADYRSCVGSKVGAISPATLSTFIAAYVSGGQSAAASAGRRFGIKLGTQCLSAPGMIAAVRAHFVAPIKAGLQTSHYSAAFKNCFLNKAEHISPSQLSVFTLHPSTANVSGVAWGKAAAQACIASGAKP